MVICRFIFLAVLGLLVTGCLPSLPETVEQKEQSTRKSITQQDHTSAWKKLFEAANEAVNKNEFNLAKTRFADARQIAETVAENGNPRPFIETLTANAFFLVRIAETDDALSMLQSAFETAVDSQLSDLEIAIQEGFLASAHRLLENFEQAENHGGHAVSVMQSSGADPQLLLQALTDLHTSQMAQQKFLDAQDSLEQMIEISKSFIENDPDRVAIFLLTKIHVASQNEDLKGFNEAIVQVAEVQQQHSLSPQADQMVNQTLQQLEAAKRQVSTPAFNTDEDGIVSAQMHQNSSKNELGREEAFQDVLMARKDFQVAKQNYDAGQQRFQAQMRHYNSMVKSSSAIVGGDLLMLMPQDPDPYLHSEYLHAKQRLEKAESEFRRFNN